MARVYCRKCRSDLAHQIALGKISPEVCEQISVAPTAVPAIFHCACERCGHTWRSKAPSVRLQYEEQISKKLKRGNCENCGSSNCERKQCVCCRQLVCTNCFVATEGLCRRCIDLVVTRFIPPRKRTPAPSGYTRCQNCTSLLWVAKGQKNCTACGASYIGKRLRCWKCHSESFVPDTQRNCDQCSAFLGRFIEKD